MATTTQTQLRHWVDSEKLRQRFWAKAGDLGLDEESVYAALGVESIHDYTGTAHDAAKALDQAAATAMVAAPAPEPGPEPPAEQGRGPEPEQEPVNFTLPVDLYALCTELPELPVVAWTKFVSSDGFTWSLTVRAGLSDAANAEALKSIKRMIAGFEQGARRYHWTPPASNGYHHNDTDSPPQPHSGPALPPGVAPSPNTDGPPAPQQDGDIPSGTAQLNAIKVDADGRVEFYVEGYRWPFKDGRGAETVAGLFDPSAGAWTPEHFKSGAKYEHLQGLWVDWRKPGKYYDVVKVYGK